MNEYLKVIRGNYANFKGRARRREYWMFFLVNFFISLILSVVSNALGWTLTPDTTNPLRSLGVLDGLYTLFVLVPALAVSVRRLHDTGRSGWWQLIAVIPLVGPLVLLFFLVQDSEADENDWGANPKALGSQSAAPLRQW
ncbi:DUF805 domain-containing protein [Deinococcus aquaedulcis]|uniref:DUF805 domain-containing protein n=1 Tax=Deinococcus aquaedulcis TaxID=2840455 RepID=UPI001C8304B2|nr:DUF805 domain-containing protein [Deinococcus aquaedulcis]